MRCALIRCDRCLRLGITDTDGTAAKDAAMVLDPLDQRDLTRVVAHVEVAISLSRAGVPGMSATVIQDWCEPCARKAGLLKERDAMAMAQMLSEKGGAK